MVKRFMLCFFVLANIASADSFLVGGIQINEASQPAWVAALKEHGMNAVPVTIYARQKDWDSAELRFETSNDGLITEIREAKKAGLTVVLILRVALDHAFPRNQFLWHGMIMPRDDATMKAWFRSYESFALHWASIAEREGVSLLGVGSEMNALASTRPITSLPDLEAFYLDPIRHTEYRTRLVKGAEKVGSDNFWDNSHGPFSSFDGYLNARDQAHRAWAEQVTNIKALKPLPEINRKRKLIDSQWRRLIRRVRERFSGSLTYAANFDQYQSVGFWDALDVMGINAYFPLRTSYSASDLSVELETGWRTVLSEIRNFRSRRGLADIPVIFTELGYTYRKGATMAPWAGSGFFLSGKNQNEKFVVAQSEPLDFRERTLAVRSLRRVRNDLAAKFLQGILYWKFSTHEYHRAVEPFVVVLGDAKDSEFVGELRSFRGVS